ncbi:hypothetical protein HPB52_005124 [Rhipicephalus sanguineus]|uniref:C2H2-type domain-containing protein n=1 Tax=Rhipicephalus sanguineus TaxID=34632 RepID=A0A9D4Q5I2_RHISA|nr:hypothetical protein HPB52_005124 [Rhipicephalus sanguineus]
MRYPSRPRFNTGTSHVAKNAIQLSSMGYETPEGGEGNGGIRSSRLRHTIMDKLKFGCLELGKWPLTSTDWNPDEGVDFAENFGSSVESGCAKRKRVLYKCMWKECGERFSTCKDVERHVRVKHLGRGDESEDSASSDHEEEFYYTESEEDDDIESDSGSTLLGEHGECTHNVYTSAPTLSHLDMARPPHEDPQYQMLARSAVPASPPNPSSASPINIPTVQRSFSWQPHASAPTAMVSPQKFMRLSPKTLSVSPKSSPLHRRVRSESRKCRKVHGMENKDMWCTQCKWKKACSRYVD